MSRFLRAATVLAGPLLAVLVLGEAAVPTRAADMRATNPADHGAPADPEAAEAHDGTAALEDHLASNAVLLLIRMTFNLLDADDVHRQLTSNIHRLATSGPIESDLIALDRALLAEGSYYLVSMRYLIQAGGAAWPTDRPARFYENDALVKLAALQERLFEAVETRADPLPIFLAAQ